MMIDDENILGSELRPGMIVWRGRYMLLLYRRKVDNGTNLHMWSAYSFDGHIKDIFWAAPELAVRLISPGAVPYP